MERTPHSSSSQTARQGMTTRSRGRGSHPPRQPPQVPARQALADPSPPTHTPVARRPAGAGESQVRSAALAQAPMDPDREVLFQRPPLTRDTARALLKKELTLHLVGPAVREACQTVYGLCIRDKLAPACIEVLMRTMLEEHAPNALRGAHEVVNLLGYIVPIEPDNQEWFNGSYRQVLVHMLVGVAQATARPGEPALTDAFLSQAALALVATPPSGGRDAKCSHGDGPQYQHGLVRQFSVEVLSQLPASSTAAFLAPLRKLGWLLDNTLDKQPRLFNHLLLSLAAGFDVPAASSKLHEHLDRLADFVLSLGLSVADAGLQLAPCQSAWAPWLPKETPQVTYRLGTLERMSGRPTLPPKRAGEVVLATLVRDAILNSPGGEGRVWQYPPLGSLKDFDTLAGIHRARLLVPGLPTSQQARLLRLVLMASDQMRGADEFRAQMHQLVVDQALHGTDLEALALLACAFVRGGGAADTKSLEQAVNLAPGTAGRKADKKAETKAGTDEGVEATPPPRPIIASSHWIDDLRRVLEPAKGKDTTADVEMEASSSTTTTSAPPTATSSSSSMGDKASIQTSRNLVQALQRGGALAANPLRALAMDDLDAPQRLALFDGALAICAPLSVADAGAMQHHLGKMSCTDLLKAQALQSLLRHAAPEFTADGQKALWGLLAQEPSEKAATRKAPARPARPTGQQFLFAKDAPLDVLKVAFQVVVEDGNRAWDAAEKARGLGLAHDHRHVIERLDATLARLAAAAEAAKKNADPRGQQIEEEALGRIKSLTQARRELAGDGDRPTSSSSSSKS